MSYYLNQELRQLNERAAIIQFLLKYNCDIRDVKPGNCLSEWKRPQYEYKYCLSFKTMLRAFLVYGDDIEQINIVAKFYADFHLSMPYTFSKKECQDNLGKLVSMDELNYRVIGIIPSWLKGETYCVCEEIGTTHPLRDAWEVWGETTLKSLPEFVELYRDEEDN